MDVDGGAPANQLPGHPANPVDSRPSAAPHADGHRRDEPSARESQEGRAFGTSLQGASHSFRRDEPSPRESQAGRAFCSRPRGVSVDAQAVGAQAVAARARAITLPVAGA
eukprot:3614291-Pyramimonas_sp.AAC.1